MSGIGMQILPFRGMPDWIARSGMGRAAIAIGLTLVSTAILIMFAGADPLAAYGAMARGAFGSMDRLAYGLNKATPLILCGVGVSLCFRAKVINIGGEGQIALGGLCAAWAALAWPIANPILAVSTAMAAGAVGGMAWAVIAATIHIARGVNEVLVTLLMNFVAALLVAEALHGPFGEAGAGFPQSALLATQYRLPLLISGSDLNVGIFLACAVAAAGHVILRHTTYGFRLRVFGESRTAAAYAGFSPARTTIGVMALAGGLAGLAGAIEILGIHYRLIEGFSRGFGFNAIAVALLASLNPAAVIPAGLFFGFLEAGTLAMQRQVGVPFSLVIVIQGLVMLLALGAMGGSYLKSGR
jgi:simple sugar transport system permease protein